MRLKPLPNTVVHVPTREEWNELCRMMRDSDISAPRDKNEIDHTFDCINVNGLSVGMGHREFYEGEGWTIIDLQTYKKEQGLMKKELKDMEVGDVLIDEGGYERTVLEVLTQSFLPSTVVSPAIASMSWNTFMEAEKYGWHFKDQPAPKKMTKASIEESLGYPVEIVEGE